MKIAFIVTSAIHVDPTNRLGQHKELPRTVHSTEERTRHTFFTLGSIFSTYPEADVFLIEASKDFKFPLEKVPSFRNLRVYHPGKNNPQLQEIITTHPNKSLCEALMTQDFINSFKPSLLEYDIIFKVSGRYIPYFRNQTTLDSSKIYFKKPLNFKWNNDWGYDLVDLRKETNTESFSQYSSVLFGFGQEHLHKFTDILEILIAMTSKPKYSHYDIETLLYYCTRPYKEHIIETDWMVSGFVGSTDDFYWY